MSYMELFYPIVEDSAASAWDSSYHNSSYPRAYETSAVVLHVSMCCEKCVHKVRKALSNVDDVESVDVDMQKQKVVVSGYPDPEKVLRKVRKVKKSAEYWDSSHDFANYSIGAYDYQGPTSSSYDYTPIYASTYSHDYSYQNPSSYDYDYDYDNRNYQSSQDYSRQNTTSRRYRSYDAYRYL